MTGNNCSCFSKGGFGCGGHSVLITSIHIQVLSGHPSTCSIGSLRTKFATYVLSTVQSWLDHWPSVSSLMIPFHHPDKFFISYHVLQDVLCFQICLFFSWSKSSPWSRKSDLLLQCFFTQQNLWGTYCVTGLFTVINKLDQKCSQNTLSVR